MRNCCVIVRYWITDRGDYFSPHKSVWPIDSTWRYRSESVFTQVVTYCLTPLSLRNKYWLIIKGVMWAISQEVLINLNLQQHVIRSSNLQLLPHLPMATVFTSPDTHTLAHNFICILFRYISILIVTNSSFLQHMTSFFAELTQSIHFLLIWSTCAVLHWIRYL